MHMSLSEPRELVMDREAWRAAIQGCKELDTIEQLNWTEPFNQEEKSVGSTYHSNHTWTLILSSKSTPVYL